MRKYHNDLLLEKQSKVLKAEQTKTRYLIEKNRKLRKEYLEKSSTSVSNTKEQTGLEEVCKLEDNLEDKITKESFIHDSILESPESSSILESSETSSILESSETSSILESSESSSILESPESSSILNKSTTVGKKNIAIKGNISKKGLIL